MAANLELDDADRSQRVDVPESELQASLRDKKELAVFDDAGYNHDVPNYMPQSVMRMLEDEGFTRAEVEGRE